MPTRTSAAPICPYCHQEVTDSPRMDVPTSCAVVLKCAVCGRDVKVIPAVRYRTEKYETAEQE